MKNISLYWCILLTVLALAVPKKYLYNREKYNEYNVNGWGNLQQFYLLACLQICSRKITWLGWLLKCNFFFSYLEVS